MNKLEEMQIEIAIMDESDLKGELSDFELKELDELKKTLQKLVGESKDNEVTT
jgi:hypothetical protein